MKIFLICESLRLGGVERLTLDQSYQLNTIGIENEVILIGDVLHESVSTFSKNEPELILEKKVRLNPIHGGRISQLRKLRNLLNHKQEILVVSHSLRGTVLVRLVRTLTRQDFKILTTIHQLSSLSAPVQRLKRYLYSRFTDQLFFFSVAAEKDWSNNMSKSFLASLLGKRKNSKVLRNGVFLPRLLVTDSVVSVDGNEKPRLIFIGRLTTWKGLEIFLKLSRIKTLSNYDFLLITPSDPAELLSKFDDQLLSRFKFEIGKSLSHIKFKKGDIHIYPANYGSKNVFIEGVSINVLEMACLGIPSLITKGGSGTWPELLELGIITEVDWNDLPQVTSCIHELSQSSVSNKTKQCRELIDIRNNINILINC